jgi:REP element-mobilizing transposase RayT
VTQPPRRKHPRLDDDVYVDRGIVTSLTICTQHRTPLFSDRQIATVLTESLARLHGDEWSVLVYCVMPDHVHALVLVLRRSAIEFVRLFKGRTSSKLRKLGHRNVWQTSFYDHIVRRHEDISAVIRYVLENPVRKGLAGEWTEYPWSGSLEWPDIDTEFFERNPRDILWNQISEASFGGG